MSAGRRRTRNGVLVLVFVVAASVGVGLSGLIAWGHPILAARWSMLWSLAAWAVAWVVAAVVAGSLPRRISLGLVLLAAVALRVAALAGPPTTSDDLYRYAWDGRVQAAGMDPYANPPSAPAVARLRQPWLWPDAAGCAGLHRPAGCTRINRPDARTIYPPVAEAWFASVYRLSGISAKHKAWQVAGLVADLAAVACILVALRRRGGDVRRLAWYALCPAPVFEFVNNAHVDGLAVALAVGAVLVLSPPRAARRLPRRLSGRFSGRFSGHFTRRLPRRLLWSEAARDVAFGTLVGAAALVKLYPALLLLIVLGAKRSRPWLSFTRAAAAAGSLALVTYLPHVLSAGVRVLGYLPGYLREEHYVQGGRFLLAGTIGLSGWQAGAASAAVLVIAVGWVVVTRPDPVTAASVLLGALFVATTPVQPWYAAGLVAFAALDGWPWIISITLAGYPYFFAVILDYRHAAGLGRAAYGAALAVVSVAWLGRRQLQARGGLRGGHDAHVDRAAAVEPAVAAGPVPGGEHRPGGAGPVTERL